jgi:hypothetical protein
MAPREKREQMSNKVYSNCDILNLPGYHSTAAVSAVLTSVINGRARQLKKRIDAIATEKSNGESALSDVPWSESLKKMFVAGRKADGKINITDCTRAISLSLSWTDRGSYVNALQKVRKLKNICIGLEQAMQHEYTLSRRYDKIINDAESLNEAYEKTQALLKTLKKDVA